MAYSKPLENPSRLPVKVHTRGPREKAVAIAVTTDTFIEYQVLSKGIIQNHEENQGERERMIIRTSEFYHKKKLIQLLKSRIKILFFDKS